MAGIINGVWSNDHHLTDADAADLDSWLTPKGVTGRKGKGGFPWEAGRYRFYLVRGCPNCHRVAATRIYCGLEAYFGVTWCDDVKRDQGWRIPAGADPVFGAESLHDLIVAAEGADITARSTLPLMLDQKEKRVVSMQSGDMVRMMDEIDNFAPFHAPPLWPEGQEDEVDALNDKIRNDVASRVYYVLFASDEAEAAKHDKIITETLKELNGRVRTQPYMMGQAITACDIWLYPTLLRLNSIYSEIFGVSAKLEQYEHLAAFTRRLYGLRAFSETSTIEPIEKHYYESLIHGPDRTYEPGLNKTPDPAKRFDLIAPSTAGA